MKENAKDLMKVLCEEFGEDKVDIRTYSPLTLAYIGDGIYDLIIRTLVVRHGNCPPNKLHRKTSSLVKASAQADMIDRIMEKLSQEELSVYRRGRNAKSYTMAKNATMKDYRKATGFETLMGYLYLLGENERMIYLIKRGLGAGWANERREEREGTEYEI